MSRCLSDEMWDRVEPLLPPQKGVMGPPFRPHRQVLEGMIYRLRTGLAWRELPAEFGPWQTVHGRFLRWATDGTFDRVWAALQAEADAAGRLDWRVSVDSTVVRVHQHGATAARTSPAGSSGSSGPTGGCGELQESGRWRGRTLRTGT